MTLQANPISEKTAKTGAKRRKALARALDRLGSTLVAAALAGSLGMALAGAFGMELSPWLLYGAAFGGCAAAALLSASPLCALITALGVGAAGVLLYRADIRPWQPAWDLLRALIEAENGEIPAVLLAAPRAVGGVGCALLGALLFGMARMQGGVYPAATLTLIAYLALWYLGGETAATPMALSLFALAALFARSRDISVPWRRALPSAAAAALLAVALLPPAGTTWAPLADAAQRVRDLVEDYFQFNTPRTTYSVANDGWQQMGERLGGPVNPLQGEVMRVETDSALLLRGSIKRSYTTYSWVDDGRNNRYLYLDPTKASLRAALFSADLASALDTSGAFAPASVRVTFLKAGTSSLFVPDVLEGLEASLDMAVYYNDTGEVFLTRDVREGDAYSAVGLTPTHGEALSALLSLASGRSDARYDSIRAEYTALPDGIDKGVYELARRVVAGAQSPYEAATLLTEYLRSGEYEYATQVDFPPYGSDFVSYFLLNGKQGYCTYFASALAVMARMVGLPSRYVEGYLAVPGADGAAVVTGEDAHAWAEIYFRGAGWIAFDPTAGGRQSADDGDSDSADVNPDATPEPSPSPQPPQPSPTPDDGQGEPDDGQPEETPAPDDLADEPTPPPEGEAPTPPPEGGQPPEEQPPEGSSQSAEDKPPFPWLWKALLALALLAALGFLLRARERATRPESIAARASDPGEKLMIWYRALLSLLEMQGRGAMPGEAPAQMAARLPRTGFGSESVAKFLQVVAVCRYGSGVPNDSAFALAESACSDALRALNRRARLRWLARRMTRGIGDYHSIP